MNEESIFAAALKIPTEHERSAFLDEACGENAALRNEVQDLLKAQQEAGSFLQYPPVELRGSDRVPGASSTPHAEAGHLPTCGAPIVREDVGADIGPYRLLERIGEGGFGVVYLAKQDRPVRRQDSDGQRNVFHVIAHFPRWCCT